MLIDSRNWNIYALAWYASLTRTFLFLFQVRIFHRTKKYSAELPFWHETRVTWYKVTRNLVSRTKRREWKVRNTSSCVRAGDLRGSVMQAASTGIGIALFNTLTRSRYDSRNRCHNSRSVPRACERSIRERSRSLHPPSPREMDEIYSRSKFYASDNVS